MAENEEKTDDAQGGGDTVTEDKGTEAAAEGTDTSGSERDAKTDEGAGSALDELLASLSGDQRSAIEQELEERERRELRKARNEARNLRERLHKAEPKAAEAEERSKSAEQKVDELNATLKAEAEGLRNRLVAETVRASAAQKFTDPGDAVAFLDMTTLLDDDLEPDPVAIGDALDDLLERKPHLAKADPKPRPPAANRSQGTSGNPAPSIDSQISDARKAGNHELAIHLELQKLGATALK